jgi:hypothetical protein
VTGKESGAETGDGEDRLGNLCHLFFFQQFEELRLVEHAHAELLGLVQLRARFDTRDDEIRFLGNRAGDLAAARLDLFLRSSRAIDESVPVRTTILPREGSAAVLSRRLASSFHFKPAARNCSTPSRLCRSRKKPAMDSATTGPTSGASINCSTLASMSASSVPKWRARSFAVTFPHVADAQGVDEPSQASCPCSSRSQQ